MDASGTIAALVNDRRALIGVLHLPALPGSPGATLAIDRIVDRALAEAQIYRDAGFNALLIENMHDRPYLKRAVGPEVTAAMAVVGRAVHDVVPLPLGVQVLAGANQAALAVALAAGAQFVRVEGFVFAHVADEGLIESDAGELLRYRRAIGATEVRVFADIKKKHSAHAITSDVDIAETARAAEFFLVDGVVVTGTVTGRPADPVELGAVANAVKVPALIGSGIAPDNIALYAAADGFIVGSWVKVDGHWSKALDPARARALAEAFRSLP